MSELAANSEYEFLSPQEAKDWGDFFQHLTEGIVSVGEIGLRQATYDDQLVINGVYRWLENGDQGDGFEEVVDDLRGIVFAGGEHSLLSKSMAVVALSDVFFKTDRWPKDVLSRLGEAMSTEPEPGGGVILSAAFWARTMFHAYNSGGQEKLEQFAAAESYFLSGDRSAESERKKIAFQKAKKVISELIRVDGMKMRLPTAFITSAKSETETVQEEIPLGYPDRTIYLGERSGQGMMPSIEKFHEASRWGVPDISNMLLNPRGLRFLMGVELQESLPESRRPGLSYVERKRMLHMFRRSLVRPMDAAVDVFASVDQWTDEQVKEFASFDSLSLWMAVRVSRELRKRWERLESLSEDEGQKFVGKMNNLNYWVDAFGDKLSDYVGRCHRDGERVSVMSVALRESQRYDGVEGWDIGDALEHVKATTRALVLKKVGNDLQLRVQTDIEQLYKDVLWDRMLDEDKVQFACALIADQQGGLLELLEYDEAACAEIIGSINGRCSLEKGGNGYRAVLGVINDVKDEVLKMRWETIRDKRVTESMLLG